MTSRSKHAGFSEETLLLIQSVYMHNKNLITIKNNSLEKLKNNCNNLAYVILWNRQGFLGFLRQSKNMHNQ